MPVDRARPYSRAEVEAAARTGAHPDRGLHCERCHVLIPQFVDLSEEAAEEIRAMGHSVPAVARLREITGCPLGWASLWIIHGGRPHDAFFGTAPCPYCGQPLRSATSRQCRFCNRDWHDPDNVRPLARP
jgi:hypothetical protein